MDYRTKINESALNMFGMLGYESYEFMTLIDHYKPWMSYRSFRMMMVGIDLFHHRFPEHVYAMARFGSVSSRFRDSATGEEIEQEYSYATCAIDFFLTVKSPYGNGVNPDLHWWIHTIGVSMQEPRSLIARVVGNPDKSATLANAMVVAYVMQRNPNLGKQFDRLTEAIDDDDEIALGPDNDLPKGRDPNIWLGYIKQQGNNIPRVIQESLARIWVQNNNARIGSIGRLLHDKAIQILNT